MPIWPDGDQEKSELGNATGRPTPAWEHVSAFLEVARLGSFRSAADRLGVSVSVLRRQITGLEEQLHVLLFTRHVDGVRLTSEGQEILESASKMEAASFGLIR